MSSWAIAWSLRVTEDSEKEKRELRRGKVRRNVTPGEARRGSAEISVEKTVGLVDMSGPSCTMSICKERGKSKDDVGRVVALVLRMVVTIHCLPSSSP